MEVRIGVAPIFLVYETSASLRMLTDHKKVQTGKGQSYCLALKG